MARTAAWMMNASGVTFTPAAAALSLSEPRSASSSVMSDSSNCVTCGMLTHAACNLRAEILLHAIERLELDGAIRRRIVVVCLRQSRCRRDRTATRHHQLDERLDV